MKQFVRPLLILTTVTVLCLSVCAGIIYYIDPFFHYHAPQSDYFYHRYETTERYCNDGVLRHFDYDALIIGISIASGYSQAEFDSIFHTKSEKVIYSGGTLKEIGEGIQQGLRYNPDMKIVFCSFLSNKLLQDKNHRRSDIKEYPTYLYNDILIDDLPYLLNKTVLFDYCYPMIKSKHSGVPGGVESLDTGGYMGKAYDSIPFFNPKEVFPDEEPFLPVPQPQLTEQETAMVQDNVLQNFVLPAREYPDTDFYYIVPPCSIRYYQGLYNAQELKKVIQAEEIAFRLMLEQENIKIFAINQDAALIEDLKNYSDSIHFGYWVYSHILEQVSIGNYTITNDNLEKYISWENIFFQPD